MSNARAGCRVSRWVLVSTAIGEAPLALEPFEEVPLDLAFLWGR